MKLNKITSISIKYKLLVLLITLPMVSIGVYFVISKNLFQKDKIAYIYTTGLSNAKGLSRQLDQQVHSVLSLEKLALKGYSFKKNKFHSFVQTLFDNDDSLKSMRVFERRIDGDYKTLNEVVKKGSVTKSLSQEFFYENFLKLEKTPKHLTLSDDKKELYLFTKSMILDNEKEKIIYILLRVQSNSVKKIFSEKSVFQNLLLDSVGKVFFSNVDSVNSTFKDWDFFKTMTTNGFSMSTTTQKSPKGEEYLISYHKLDSGVYIVSMIKSSVALIAIDNMTKKMYFFLLVIFCGSVVIAILGSQKLTKAILEISEMAKKLGKGDFEVRVHLEEKDEVGKLGDTFNSMAEKISKLLKEIKEYSEKLETMVEERTIDLSKALGLQKAMVDSLHDGFFVFDKDLMATDVYSKATVDMFDGAPAGKSLSKVLTLESNKAQELEIFCDQLFDEDLPFKDMACLLPNHFENKTLKQIVINYSPIRDDSGKISGVVLIGQDKTNELKALKESKSKKKFVEMVLKIIGNKQQFTSTVVSAYQKLNNLELILESIEKYEKDSGEEVVDLLYRTIHTLKGLFAFYHLEELEDLCHSFEDELSDSKIEKSKLNFDKCKGSISLIANSLLNFLEQNQTIVGNVDLDGEGGLVEIPMSHLNEYYTSLKKNEVNHKMVEDFVENIFGQTFSNLTIHYSQLAQDLALQNNKKINEISITDGGVKFIPTLYQDLFESFVHIYRNIIDHAIEEPFVRKELGKSPNGQISIIVSQDKAKVFIAFSDDGKGICIDELKKKVQSSYTDKDNIPTSDKDILDYIFKTGFSSNEMVTTLSGRGVGLGAVKEEVMALGGSITVDTIKGKGTTFYIELPRII